MNRTNNPLLDGSLTHSPAAIKSLLALSTALQELGSILEPSRRDVIAKETLYSFLEAMADIDEGQKLHAGHRWTILFLRKILDKWEKNWLKSAALQIKLQKIIGVCPPASLHRYLSIDALSG
jgi:hypothetical protein